MITLREPSTIPYSLSVSKILLFSIFRDIMKQTFSCFIYVIITVKYHIGV